MAILAALQDDPQITKHRQFKLGKGQMARLLLRTVTRSFDLA